MARVRPRVKVPRTADKDEVITIKTLISHKMESGQRKDRKTGKIIPRQIINKFTAEFNGQAGVLRRHRPGCFSEPVPEVFNAKVPKKQVSSKFTWVDDDGSGL